MMAKDTVSTKATPPGESPLERVGKAVADRRVEVGLETQRELADAANVSLNTAALLERGKSFPHRINRVKFEDALQWPRGTLDALRRGEPIPQTQPRPAAAITAQPSLESVSTDPRTTLQALGIAKAIAAISAICTQILVRHSNSAQAKATLRDLDDQLLQLESLVVATLPHVRGKSFSETMSALTELHEYRDVIRDAAEDAQASTETATPSAGAPHTRLASAKS